jgi:hypothetical protein
VQEIRRGFRRSPAKPSATTGDKWHLDEVFIRLQGVQHYLWRAVDQDGVVLNILVQPRRNSNAAKRLLKRLLKGLECVPRVIVTNKLRSYGAAQRQLLPGVEHRKSRYLNIGPRTRTGQRDDGNGRCSGSNRPNKPKPSSPLTRLSMVISIHAVTNLRPIPIARSGRTLSRFGTRKRAPNAQDDRHAMATTLGVKLPGGVNVTVRCPRVCENRGVDRGLLAAWV